MHRPRQFSSLTVIAAAAAIVVAPLAHAAPQSSTQKLEAKLDLMAQQLLEMRGELTQLKQENTQLKAQQQQQAQTTQQTASDQATLKSQVEATSQSVQTALAKPSPLDNLNIWGYGEMYYSRPTRQSENTRADLARGVFGIGYQFDDKTRFNSEFEIEHGVTSSSDPGEFEVEQFYVDHKFNDSLSGKAGLFLIPAGLINENHEPTNFYGVTRNFVETLIIPSTWREGGLSLSGDTKFGLGWSAGVTTGLDLSKWNFTPTSPLYTSALELQNNSVAPMQATHQEMALANAQKLSGFVSLNYRGVPGLTVGGSVFNGGTVKATPDMGSSQRVTLYEAHARYQPGPWDLSALYAHGSFSHTAEANASAAATAAANGQSLTNPMPASFYGWYLQAAYNARVGGYRLAPFVRYEKYNMAASYEGVGSGFSMPSGFAVPHDTVYTVGANFYLNQNVVFKVDYQRFKINRDFSRIDLGLGVTF
ncbi:OprO/OprP family phosphate-selective porin [Burkholderia sp. S-53]|uniref:OprO/OprP family phosphate-selective porin n=1 Tax=Burkholderia sp. S-53 TaxID=2906514 RepID=UPI0021CFC2D3|nr:OprO/OprP family phosphate-selective porin [Burkholderia sp. S-53]UXU90082.1 OprO/OprP family phosphate-selective porin [Burkholderia sp. S-53]